MPDRDHYAVLDVARDATPDQIKKAYRALARKYHPDANPGDKTAEAKFKEVQKAYDLLSDPEKKTIYDRIGHAAYEQYGSGGPRMDPNAWAARGAGGPGANFENVDLGAFFANAGGGGARVDWGTGEESGGGIFEELLGRMRGSHHNPGAGQRRRPSPPRQPAHSEAALTIPFLTAIRGGETSIDITRENGRKESLVVTIPPGLENGKKIRLKGQGEADEHGGPRGDLTITVTVDAHPYFSRDGRNLLVEVPITVGEAILGAKVDVPTLNGPKSVPIPPGTSSGQKLRLRGQGIPAHKEIPAGDLHVVPKVVVPRTVDDASRALIEQFAEKNPQNPRQGMG